MKIFLQTIVILIFTFNVSAQNYSLNFDGSAYINLPNSLVTNPSQFTIESWVKPSQ